MKKAKKPAARRNRIIAIAIAAFAVVALFAAPFIYAAFQPNHFPFEPPIEEQIEFQYSALLTGAEIPMPIPLVVGDAELADFSHDALRDALLKSGFSQVTAQNLHEFGPDVQANYRQHWTYASRDEKLVVYWHEKQPGSKNKTIITDIPAMNLTSKQIGEYFADGCGEIVSLPFGANMGAPIGDVFNHTKWIDMDYTIERPLSEHIEVIEIGRGVYSYIMVFYHGRLVRIVIWDSLNMKRKDVNAIQMDEKQQKLAKYFGKQTPKEKLNRSFLNSMARLGY